MGTLTNEEELEIQYRGLDRAGGPAGNSSDVQCSVSPSGRTSPKPGPGWRKRAQQLRIDLTSSVDDEAVYVEDQTSPSNLDFFSPKQSKSGRQLRFSAKQLNTRKSGKLVESLKKSGKLGESRKSTNFLGESRKSGTSFLAFGKKKSLAAREEAESGAGHSSPHSPTPHLLLALPDADRGKLSPRIHFGKSKQARPDNLLLEDSPRRGEHANMAGAKNADGSSPVLSDKDDSFRRGKKILFSDHELNLSDRDLRVKKTGDKVDDWYQQRQNNSSSAKKSLSTSMSLGRFRSGSLSNHHSSGGKVKRIFKDITRIRVPKDKDKDNHLDDP